MKLEIKEEASIISTLYNAGFSMRQIGRKILVSPATVKRRLVLSGTHVRSSDEGVKLASSQGRLNNKRPRVK